MIVKQNCWEFMKCERQPGGARAERDGICPATTESTYDNTNGGYNAGRVCWAISGTYCGGADQTSVVKKQVVCGRCAFFAAVKGQEGSSFRPLGPGMHL